MSLIDKLPSMSDAELENLKQNAEALAGTGTDKQKSAIANLMPALEAELIARQERAAAERAAKRPPAKPRRAKKKEDEGQIGTAE
jgi:hypothetical protein